MNLNWPDDYMNKIICGDCLEIMRTMPDNAVDFIVTSPPYNANLRIHYGQYCLANDWRSAKYNTAEDAMPVEEFAAWQCDCIREMLRVSRQHVIYNIQILTGNKPAIFDILHTFKDQVKELAIWDKQFGEPAINVGVLNSCFEFIIFFSNDKPIQRQFEEVTFGRGDLDNIFRVQKNRATKIPGHNAIMPLELAKRLIMPFPGKVIMDPFAGTGTTPLAAKQLGRSYIAIEKRPAFREIAVQRLAQFELFSTGGLQ